MIQSLYWNTPDVMLYIIGQSVGKTKFLCITQEEYPMLKTTKCLVIILLLILSQLAVYKIFYKQSISSWGTTTAESSMAMVGDDIAPFIASTRAITINAPITDVWEWIMQLGADRGGFYSYYFIEKSLGYVSREQSIVKPEFDDFVVGDLVRGSVDEEKSLVVYNFPVVHVEKNRALVLEAWGTFLLKEISENETRLLIRTHGLAHTNILHAIADFIATPLHFVMERGTLKGIKARAETGIGAPLSDTANYYWFSGIVFTAILITLLTFILKGAKAILLPALLSTIWLYTFLMLPPIPSNSLLLLVISVTISCWALFYKPSRSAAKQVTS